MHILVAEDDQHLQSIVETILSLRGIRVTCVSDGNSALKLLLGPHDFDLALVDLNLPSLSGERLILSLRQALPQVHCPVAIMSATGDPGAPERLIGLGAAGFLAKPFAHLDLVNYVTELASTSKKEGAA